MFAWYYDQHLTKICSVPNTTISNCSSLNETEWTFYTRNHACTQYCRAVSTPKPQAYRAGNKTVGRWLKDRKEKKKEETRAHNAQVHAAVSVAAVAAAVAAVAAATAAASASGKDERAARTDMAVASAATLVAAQCVEAAESIGAEREHLEAVVGSAVNVRTPGDIVTVTAAAATGVCRVCCDYSSLAGPARACAFSNTDLLGWLS